jgi:cytidine deaminase
MKDLAYKHLNGRKIYEITDEVCEQLLQEANRALANRYPIADGGFAVACLTAAGNIYTGASYKSETYTLTMHAEAVALSHAAQHGEKEIIAITGPNCHICKQLLWESCLHSGIEIATIIKENGVIKRIPISEVMPYPWPDENGNTKIIK